MGSYDCNSNVWNFLIPEQGGHRGCKRCKRCKRCKIGVFGIFWCKRCKTYTNLRIEDAKDAKTIFMLHNSSKYFNFCFSFISIRVAMLHRSYLNLLKTPYYSLKNKISSYFLQIFLMNKSSTAVSVKILICVLFSISILHYLLVFWLADKPYLIKCQYEYLPKMFQ